MTSAAFVQLISACLGVVGSPFFSIGVAGLLHAAESLSVRGFSLSQEASAKLLESKFEWIAFPDTLHKGEVHCNDKYGICDGEFSLNDVTFAKVTVTYEKGKKWSTTTATSVTR